MPVELVVQRAAQLGGHRVEPVGAVEGQQPDLGGRALAEKDVGHGSVAGCEAVELDLGAVAGIGEHDVGGSGGPPKKAALSPSPT